MKNILVLFLSLFITCALSAQVIINKPYATTDTIKATTKTYLLGGKIGETQPIYTYIGFVFTADTINGGGKAYIDGTYGGTVYYPLDTITINASKNYVIPTILNNYIDYRVRITTLATDTIKITNARWVVKK